MTEPVLDASVVLAILRHENLQEQAVDLLDACIMSTVNLAEVYTKLSDLGIQDSPAVDELLRRVQRVEPFTQAQSRATGLLRKATRHAGLSLGDRACLALALELGTAAYTTDRNWLRVDVGCPIHCLR